MEHTCKQRMGLEVFTVASLGSKTNAKNLILSASDASVFFAITDEYSIAVSNFVAIRYFYLPRFELMIGTFLDVIFTKKKLMLISGY